MPFQLQIKHTGFQDDQAQFMIVRGSDLKSSAPVTLIGPDQTVVPGRPNSNLQQDLRWYLENFLELPTGAYPDVAERVQDCLREWGKSCFEVLFQKQAYLWFQEARQKRLENLHLKISSDDPRVLAWPWEALYDPEGGTLAHHCRIERQLNQNIHDPLSLPDNLPKDRINILLVIARPGGDEDVGFHALSRPLVELTRDRHLPVHIDVLRPPTFDQLRQQLRDKTGFYHIVHFDGHGGYGTAEDHISSDLFKSKAQGRLLFENDEAGAAPVKAKLLSELLAEYRIPIMVLNACQSARIDEQAEDAFASVAAALLKAGIRSVVAMGYNLYVSGAQQFIPAFYRRLLETANVAEAVCAGRQAMLAHDQRPCLLGEYPLQDWLVPVLYQQMQADETAESIFAAQPTLATPAPQEGNTFTLEQNDAPDPLPEEARKLGDDGFIGRQQPVQQLERARLRQPQAAFLIHGMAGVGKTTLAKGFLHWLRDTGGLEQKVFWFSFDEIRSAEYVINQLVDSIFGTEALAAPLEQKLAGLIKTLRAHPFLLVWDNFESASGIEGTEIRSMLSEDDRGLLKELLAGLRNGKTKVLITSRSAEKWLSTGECFRLPLSGLHGEELWQYCNQVLRDLGLTVKRDDEDFLELINELDGHPLALRAVLLRLKDKGAKELLADLRKEFALFEGDASSNRIFAALAVLDQGLPEEYSPVLQLIGLHRWFVDQDYLEQMLQNAEEATSTIQPCFALLETTGLLHDFGSNIFQMHPALQTHLKQRHPAARSLQRAFIDFMGSFADQLAPKELHEQSGSFSLHLANCWHALNIAQQLGIEQNVAALRQGIATYALNIRDYTGACQLFESLASQQKKYKNYKEEAAAYHQLGIVALEQRNFTTAEKWYEKSLSIEKKLGGELGGEFTYHQLGIIALEKNNFPAAKKLCEESLKIKKKLGHENEMATTYYQLGRIAQAQSDLVTAKKWYKKALALFEKLKQSQNVADTYNELGIIALDQNDFAEAEKWCSNSLMIKRKNGNEYRLGPVYHMLGSISIEKNDFIEAEKWSKAALTIFEKQGDEYGTANCYHQIGVLSHLQKAYWDAGRWYLKAILSFMHLENPHNAADGIKNFIMVLHAADPETEITLRKNWQQSGIDQTITLDQLEQQLNEQN